MLVCGKVSDSQSLDCGFKSTPMLPVVAHALAPRALLGESDHTGGLLTKYHRCVNPHGYCPNGLVPVIGQYLERVISPHGIWVSVMAMGEGPTISKTEVVMMQLKC